MKTIIYLDQNYASYLAKARLGVKLYPGVASCYHDLYGALHEAVERNLVVCPASTMHRTESSHDTRLAPEIYRTLDELSGGVQILFWGDILQLQVFMALHDYLGKPRPPFGAWADVTADQDLKKACRIIGRPPPETGRRAGAEPWREAFNKDPHGPYERSQPRLDSNRLDLLLDLERWIKAYHEQQGQLVSVGNLHRQKRAEAYAWLKIFYLRPVRHFVAGDVGLLTTGFMLSGLEPLSRLCNAYHELTGRKPGLALLLQFFASEEAAKTPFVDIYSSLQAAMIVWTGERRRKGSDLNDLLIASAVLPYCDVFATDRHIKQLIIALKLDRKYDVKVFGARKADVEALTSLVRTLADGTEVARTPFEKV